MGNELDSFTVISGNEEDTLCTTSLTGFGDWNFPGKIKNGGKIRYQGKCG